jgi:hypothetical protein
MTEESRSRDHAVARLEEARERRDEGLRQHDAASGSPEELRTFADLQAAEEQVGAREAWLEWVDRDY